MFYLFLSIALFMAFLLGIYDYIQLSNVKVARNHVSSYKITNPITIAHLSDFHSNSHIDIKTLIMKIDNENPDLILITGDIIEGNEKDLKIVDDFIGCLVSINTPIFVVEGNHEVRSPNYNKLIELLASYNIPLLRNQYTSVSVNGNSINILGYCNGTEFEFSLENEDYTIAMVHDPLWATMNSPRSDLILTGHTHGGQVRLPVIGAVFAPSQGLFPMYNKGLYGVENRKIYVDSGLGWTRFPIRILNPVQFTIHTITEKSKTI